MWATGTLQLARPLTDLGPELLAEGLGRSLLLQLCSWLLSPPNAAHSSAKLPSKFYVTLQLLECYAIDLLGVLDALEYNDLNG